MNGEVTRVSLSLSFFCTAGQPLSGTSLLPEIEIIVAISIVTASAQSLFSRSTQRHGIRAILPNRAEKERATFVRKCRRLFALNHFLRLLLCYFLSTSALPSRRPLFSRLCCCSSLICTAILFYLIFFLHLPKIRLLDSRI